MNPAVNDQINYDRPHRALDARAGRRVIDGYPAGYLTELARPFLARADRKPGSRAARVRHPGSGPENTRPGGRMSAAA
jgi:hypothetical protein